MEGEQTNKPQDQKTSDIYNRVLEDFFKADAIDKKRMVDAMALALCIYNGSHDVPIGPDYHERIEGISDSVGTTVDSMYAMFQDSVCETWSNELKYLINDYNVKHDRSDALTVNGITEKVIEAAKRTVDSFGGRIGVMVDTNSSDGVIVIRFAFPGMVYERDPDKPALEYETYYVDIESIDLSDCIGKLKKGDKVTDQVLSFSSFGATCDCEMKLPIARCPKQIGTYWFYGDTDAFTSLRKYKGGHQ